ncbi:unnamed protein product [Candidula unifasciata]|uniref:Uncharacterized protein n=1 Tax=Candidula unifasciata TaxID=100452 RepID=A0A8S3Z9Z9_9EUPU|nr:unnamed protein product [Candidula unifasciata]
MANINRIGSPMDLLDEGLSEPPDKIKSRKQFLRDKQRTKSPFLIGSIEEVNMRISQLDQKLQNYAQLVCESRASQVDDVQSTFSSSKERDLFDKREKDKKEVCQFAGVYTLKSTFLPNLSSRVKNISKISIAPKENKMAVISKEEAGKPKFVELHLYPGFDPQELTPLPAGFEPDDILRKVVQASVHPQQALGSKQKIEQLLVSRLSQAILLDIFWYLFLQKFQPDTPTQQKLFNRVAHNYVHLLMSSSDIATKDIFFKAYPKLMSQAVYSSFCHCFPDSYRQFGEHFRDDLVNLVYAWMAGIRPSPRIWLSWNMSSLEPAGVKQREDMMNRKNNKKGAPLFELDNLVSTSASQDNSTRTRSPSLSTTKSSTGSVKTVRISQGVKGAAIASKALSPIHEMVLDGSDSELQQKSPQGSGKIHRHKAPIQDLESHPVGKSCDYVQTVFDVHGKSPLVEHFLRLKGLNHKAGQLVLVQRLELENLPPYPLLTAPTIFLDTLSTLDASTYKDVIISSSRSMRHRKMLFKEQQSHNVKVARARISECKKQVREHIRRQTSLLADQERVKKLSDLIIMEQRRSKNSVTAGADAALTASLMSEH